LEREDVIRILIDPSTTITIDPEIADNEPSVSKGQWIKANVRLIDELGVEAWLVRLLDVLEDRTLGQAGLEVVDGRPQFDD
jgi:hypothetical protein